MKILPLMAHTADLRRAAGPSAAVLLVQGAQYIVLMDDTLAIELQMHGAVPEIFINADGVKTSWQLHLFSKAVAAAINIVGKRTVQAQLCSCTWLSTPPTESQNPRLLAEWRAHLIPTVQ